MVHETLRNTVNLGFFVQWWWTVHYFHFAERSLATLKRSRLFDRFWTVTESGLKKICIRLKYIYLKKKLHSFVGCVINKCRGIKCFQNVFPPVCLIGLLHKACEESYLVIQDSRHLCVYIHLSSESLSYPNEWTVLFRFLQMI